MRGARAAPVVAFALAGCSLDAAGMDASGHGGSGAMPASSSSAASGGGSGGQQICSAGRTEGCYPAPPDTRGVGECKGGERACAPDGTWGDCQGAVVPSVEVCASSADESCDGVAACTGAPTFGLAILDASDYGGQALATNAEGTVLVVAGVNGSLDIGGGLVTQGDLDVLVVELDATGKLILAKRFGDASLQAAHGVAFDSAGNIVVGGSLAGQLDFGSGAMINDGVDGTQDAYLAKLDPNGVGFWGRDWGDTADQDLFDVAVDATDHVVVVGKFLGSMDMGQGAMTSAGGDDIFVARLDPEGETLWSKRFGADGRQAAVSVGVTKAGDAVFVGDFGQTFDFGGPALTTSGPPDVFVARLSVDGAHVFSRGFGGPYDDYAGGVVVDGEDATIVAGQVRGNVDFGAGPDGWVGADADVFVVKYDATGAFEWVQRFGDANDQWANSVTVDSAGQIVVVGNMIGAMTVGDFMLASDGGLDVFAIKLDPAGEIVWAQRFGDTNPEQRGFAAMRGPVGETWLYGVFDGTIPLGATAGTLTAATGADPFLIRLAP